MGSEMCIRDRQEGHTKRVEAEKTLYQMENDLKKKLLETKI